MASIPTVKIKSPKNKRDGYAIINESDFDKSRHQMFDTKPPKRELEAVHRGRGSYSVMRGDEEVVESLKKAEAEKFNKMDGDAKAAFVERTD